MPRLVHSVPRYRLHKSSRQAVVTIDGSDHYLGPWQSKASKYKYDRLIGEWLARGRQPLVAPDDLTIIELVARFWRHAKTYYVKRGRPTGELDNIRHAVRPLKALYGRTQAADFKPLCLKALRQKLIDAGLCRNVINARIGHVKRLFRWGVEEELVEEGIYSALAQVAGLKEGRTSARESEEVKPVAAEIVAATLPHLPQVVADMVRVQQLCGSRPSEVCTLRPCDIERTSDVWVYRPESHKTEHRQRERAIFLGPQAQAVLLPYLLRDAEAFCFSPADSESQRRAAMRSRRKSKVQPSQVDRSKAHPRRKPGLHYDAASYRTAVHRACDKAFGKAEGPFTWEQLLTRKQWRKLKPRDLLRRGTTGRWKRASSVQGIFGKRPPVDAEAPMVPKDDWYFKAAIPRWSPNQLRHSTATALRKQFGIEAARLILGHSKIETSEIYAERDQAKAAEIMREVG